ncbi:MAG: KTSC domain-containing protein [Limisphaerales bacterium]
MMLVNGSSIRAVGCDGYRLFVQFHGSDIVYTHYGVPHSVYAGLMQASSMGAYYYNHYIRGKYRSTYA